MTVISNKDIAVNTPKAGFSNELDMSINQTTVFGWRGFTLIKETNETVTSVFSNHRLVCLDSIHLDANLFECRIKYFKHPPTLRQLHNYNTTLHTKTILMSLRT